MTRHPQSRTVRPRDGWTKRKLFYLTTFVLTCAAVYRWGLTSRQQPRHEASCSSTAVVLQQIETALDRSPPSSKQDFEGIQRKILSEAYLRRTVTRLGFGVDPSPGEHPALQVQRAIESVRGDLDVVAAESSRPGELRVSLTCTSHRPENTALIVNDLATAYADDCRAKWKERTHRAYLDAKDAADRAQGESMRTEARLEAFSELLLAQRDATEPTAQQPSPEDEPAASEERVVPGTGTAPPRFEVGTDGLPDPSTRPPRPDSPPITDNPDWIDLAERLSELVRRRTRMLDDMTAEHPALKHVELQIEEVERQLQATHRTIPKPNEDPPPANPPAEDPAGPEAARPLADPEADRHIEDENLLKLRTLADDADRAAQLYQRAAEAQLQARQRWQQQPRIEVQLARPVEVVRTEPQRPLLRLLLAALTSGAAVTLGIGMVSFGFSMESTLVDVCCAWP